MIRSSVFVAFALAGAALVGCVREEKFTQRRARAWCEHAVDCGSFRSISDCMSASPADNEDPYLEAAIDAGRIEYDEWAARRCIRAIKRLKCLRDEDESEVDAECAAVFTGKVGPDEPCYRGAECVGESSLCATVPSACSVEDSCCPGVCRYIADSLAEGEICGGRTRCAEGLHCPPATVDEPQQRCAALPKVGEPCPTRACEEGAFCDEDTCVSKQAVGGACVWDGGCLSDFCAYDWVDGLGTCAERSKTGGACDEMYGDNGCERVRDRCVDGECVRPKVGDECDSEDYYSETCPDYAHCYEGKCVSYRYEGESCDEGKKDCYGSLTCYEGGAFGRECAFLQESSPPDEACSVPE